MVNVYVRVERGLRSLMQCDTNMVTDSEGPERATHARRTPAGRSNRRSSELTADTFGLPRNKEGWTNALRSDTTSGYGMAPAGSICNVSRAIEGAIVGRPWAHWKGSSQRARASRIAWQRVASIDVPNMTAWRHAFEFQRLYTGFPFGPQGACHREQ